ncbi:DUF2199 domain-containing protein [Ralstonia sp. NFACC01]|uniref:DUF2199 domain-containing protein n=1 Tax=Ralstonia sp. NFACC01 TaxID=1566294 RepID=UPI001113B8A9
MTFAFQCATCGETHEGMPSFVAAAPVSYYEIPATEREARCDNNADILGIDR